MSDLSKLAAERCAELANAVLAERNADPVFRYQPAEVQSTSNSMCRAFQTYAINGHTLAEQAIADPSNAATILAPLLVKRNALGWTDSELDSLRAERDALQSALTRSQEQAEALAGALRLIIPLAEDYSYDTGTLFVSRIEDARAALAAYEAAR